MQHSALDLLFGNQTGNPNDPRPNVKPPNTLDQFLGSSGGSLLVNLLSQQGFSRTPQSPFGALGRGLLQTQQQQEKRGQSDLQRQLIESVIGLNKFKATPGGLNATAGNVQTTFKGANGNMHIVTRRGDVKDTGIKFDKNLEFLEQADGSVEAFDRTTGKSLGSVINPEQAADATTRSAITKKTSEVQATAIVDLRESEQRVANNLALLDQLEGHAGFSSAVGAKGISSVFGALDEPIGGSPAADVVSIINQVGGSVFLEAFQKLKGGGHITEIEGLKAEQAIARIRDRQQSEKGMKNAIQELRDILDEGIKNKRKEAQGDFTPDTGKSASEMTIAELEAIERGGNP